MCILKGGVVCSHIFILVLFIDNLVYFVFVYGYSFMFWIIVVIMALIHYGYG